MSCTPPSRSAVRRRSRITRPPVCRRHFGGESFGKSRPGRPATSTAAFIPLARSRTRLGAGAERLLHAVLEAIGRLGGGELEVATARRPVAETKMAGRQRVVRQH